MARTKTEVSDKKTPEEFAKEFLDQLNPRREINASETKMIRELLTFARKLIEPVKIYTAEELVRTFCFDGPPYQMQFEYRTARMKQKQPALDELIKTGLVRPVFKDTKIIIYQYVGPPPIEAKSLVRKL